MKWQLSRRGIITGSSSNISSKFRASIQARAKNGKGRGLKLAWFSGTNDSYLKGA
jgi:hypothetical protein